jgi:hypothetical protein
LAGIVYVPETQEQSVSDPRKWQEHGKTWVKDGERLSF